MADRRKKYTKDDAPDSLSQLKTALKARNPGRLYVFYGEESYLRSYYLDVLRKQLTEGPAEEFNFHRFTEENMDLGALQDAIEAMPMMAERSMVQVDDYPMFDLPENERERLAEILSDIPEHCCLVFCYQATEFKPDKRKKKLYEALNQPDAFVEFRKQGIRELSGWVRRHFAKHHKNIDDRLIQYLIHITDGTMTSLASEIEKICTYSETDQILKTDIDAVVEPVLEALAFDITDAIAEHDYGLALRKLQIVIKMQEEPIRILGAIGSSMRRIRTAKVLISNKKGKNALMELYKPLAPYAAEKTMNAAAHLSQTFCDQAVLLCAETDYRMKHSYDDQIRLLELLILQMAEAAQHD